MSNTLSVSISVDTRPTPRPICCDRLSVAYQSTGGGVSVNCQCYQSIVNCCFAEIAAVSLPTGDAKEEYRLCSCVDRPRMQFKLLPFRIHMLCNLRSCEALSRKKGTHTKISRGVQSMEKAVDRLISIDKIH